MADLISEQIIGQNPRLVGSLTDLIWLSLSDNGLAGSIPTWLGNFNRLRSLGLENNQLVGEIPPELGSLAELRYLGLGGNGFTGSIPAWLGELDNLQRLVLSENQLTGPIPAELGALSDLIWLYLSNNQLTGPIPADLGGLSNLERLYLAQNQLTGCIPGGSRSVAENDLYDLDLPYCDVLLSGLTVTPGTLVPQFDPYRTAYSASVGLSPVTVSIVSTNDHSATFLFLDENDREIADADSAGRAFRSISAPASPPSRSRSSHRTV